MEQISLKDELKYVGIGVTPIGHRYRRQSAMLAGIGMKLKWSAGSFDSLVI